MEAKMQSFNLIKSTSIILQEQNSLHCPPTPQKKNPTRKCRVCATKNIRKETRYHCPSCPDKPPLSILDFVTNSIMKIKYYK